MRKKKFNFCKLQEDFNNSYLQNKYWSYSSIKNEVFGFQKIEMDCNVRKRIVVFPDLHIEIYVDDKLAHFSKCIRLCDMNHLCELVKCVDNFVFSKKWE